LMRHGSNSCSGVSVGGGGGSGDSKDSEKAHHRHHNHQTLYQADLPLAPGSVRHQTHDLKRTLKSQKLREQDLAFAEKVIIGIRWTTDGQHEVSRAKTASAESI
jgi:hypothetical protein